MPSNNGPASFPVTAGPAADDILKIGSDALPEPNKWFFIEDYAKLGVKGNMLPLVITPTTLDIAEWLAHQSKCESYCEHRRLLIDCCQQPLSSTAFWRTSSRSSKRSTMERKFAILTIVLQCLLVGE